MRILVTAFDPFGGEDVNAAMQAALSLPGSAKGYSIDRLIVPTVFGESADLAIGEITRFCPDAVLCTGQATGRAALAIERIAINMGDAAIADNRGVVLSGKSIVPDGPAAYFSTLPIMDIVHAVRQGGIPAEVSNSAGTFVCNYLFYSVLHHLHTNGRSTPAGFIHIPCLPAQAARAKGATPSMAVEQSAKGLLLAMDAIAAHLCKLGGM